MTAQAGNLTLQDCDISRVFPRLSVDTFVLFLVLILVQNLVLMLMLVLMLVQNLVLVLMLVLVLVLAFELEICVPYCSGSSLKLMLN